ELAADDVEHGDCSRRRKGERGVGAALGAGKRPVCPGHVGGSVADSEPAGVSPAVRRPDREDRVDFPAAELATCAAGLERNEAEVPRARFAAAAEAEPPAPGPLDPSGRGAEPEPAEAATGDEHSRSGWCRGC